MKIIYFASEVPYPAVHGGAVDTWTRIQALKSAGAEVALISWYAEAAGRPHSNTIDALEAQTSWVQLLPVRADWVSHLRRLLRLWRWPSHVSSRVPTKTERRQLWTTLDKFKPDAVWLDALYPMVLAHACAKRYQIPVFYRSHNIEHKYMAAQVARSARWRDKLAWSMNLPNLHRVETQTLRAAHTFFDISVDDLRWWQKQGLSNGQWLAPLVLPTSRERLSTPHETTPPFDVGYLGNLRTPNNVEGVLWFLKEVWPSLRSTRPESTMLLAGSNPVEEIKSAVKHATGITLRENAPDAVQVLRSARVLVNPVFAGSGVNIKSVEMLFSPARLVSTPQGVAGLPSHVQSCFAVANESRSFTEAVLAQLKAGPLTMANEVIADRQRARDEFDFKKMNGILQHMRQAVQRN